ncbi:hypothetical protein VKT23_015740 [Stygiomarasmius scandens]|uniref:Gag protein n=1 Tax=Marasmiellus scandens TaxID=2682957 RepID=A0ABR1J1M9_9AGAR
MEDDVYNNPPNPESPYEQLHRHLARARSPLKRSRNSPQASPSKRPNNTGLSRSPRTDNSQRNPAESENRYNTRRQTENIPQHTPHPFGPIGFAAGDQSTLIEPEGGEPDEEDDDIEGTPRQQRIRTHINEMEPQQMLDQYETLANSLVKTAQLLQQTCPQGMTLKVTAITERMIESMTNELGLKTQYNNQLDALLTVTASLVNEVRTLSNEVNLHREQTNKMKNEIMEQRAIIERHQKQLTTTTSNTPITTYNPNTYAAKVALGTKAHSSNTKQENQLRREEDRKTRLVAFFNPGIPTEQRRSNFDIVRDINKILANTPGTEGLRVASVGWSQRGNAILSTIPGQLASRLEEFAYRFNHVYTKNDDTRPSDSAPDEHWHKIAVHAVNTGIHHAHTLNGGIPRLWTQDELLQQMHLHNPQLKENGINIKMGPRFMSPPGNITSYDISAPSTCSARDVEYRNSPNAHRASPAPTVKCSGTPPPTAKTPKCAASAETTTPKRPTSRHATNAKTWRHASTSNSTKTQSEKASYRHAPTASSASTAHETRPRPLNAPTELTTETAQYTSGQ